MAAAHLGSTLKKRVRELIRGSDLERFTERQLRLQLEEEFGASAVAGNAQLVKACVDEELERLVEQQEDEEDVGCGGLHNKKLKVETVSVSASSAGVSGPPLTAEDSSLVLSLPQKRKASVRTFKGKVHVDLREYYEDGGKEKPGRKGVALSVSEWEALAAALPSLVAALQRQDQNQAPVQLSELRRASISNFGGKFSAHVREYYRDSTGELKPGQKGTTLQLEALQLLARHAPELSAHAAKLGGLQVTHTHPNPLLTAPTDAAAGAATTAATGGGAARAPAGVGGASGGAASVGAVVEAAGAIELGANKRATLGDYSGTLTVDLREWYRKDTGELAPTKKGISLKRDEWCKMVDELGSITQALASKDIGFVLQLSSMRKVTVSEFKGTHSVSVREFFKNKQSGQDQPGAKGLNMNAEQWAKLAGAALALTAVLDARLATDARSGDAT